MKTVSRVVLPWILAAFGLLACAVSGPGDGVPEGEPDMLAPAPPRTDDAVEDQIAAAEIEADLAAEIDGDELEVCQTSTKHGSGVMSTAAGTAAGACDEELGSFDYCDDGCTCQAGEGDCDDHGECAVGLRCMRDTGALFGFDPELDVCMELCSDDASGTADFCSSECPCSASEGDCDRDTDCAAGNVCAKNVGASFGLPADVDVCVDACDPIRNGGWDFCSPACPCEHGQGDCDRDTDCAPGHVCTKNVGAEYGLPADMDVCVEIPLPRETFAGTVVDSAGAPLAQVAVTINRVEYVTGEDGTFSLEVPINADSRYVIDVDRFGYVPQSIIHFGDGLIEMVVPMKHAQVLSLPPGLPIDVTDDSGTRIALSATPQQALVDAAGEPPKEPVLLQMHTFDVAQEGMVGNMEGVDVNGNAVVLQSAGAFSADFVGISGTEYELAPGQSATVSVEFPEGMVSPPGPVSLWFYDRTQGRWLEEEGEVIVDMAARTITTHVGHFSEFNLDAKFEDSSCVLINVQLAPGGSLLARVEVDDGGLKRSQVNLLEGPPQQNLLFNMPPNRPARLFIPPTATTALHTFDTGPSHGGVGRPSDPATACSTEALGKLTSQVVGIVDVEGRSNEASATVTILKDDDPGPDIQITQVPPTSRGQYSVGEISKDTSGATEQLKEGRYRVEISAPGHLPVHIPNPNHEAIDGFFDVSGGAVVQLPCVQLPGGDVNEDNRINQADIDLLNDTPPGPLPSGDPRDVNGNGTHDPEDDSITSDNQNKTGPLLPADAPCRPPEGVNVQDIAAGNSHTCALIQVGTSRRLRCWGGNSSGQLGYGDIENMGDNEFLISMPAAVTLAEPVVEFSAGGHHTCAIIARSGGGQSLRCWGLNSSGQLGYGDTNNRGNTAGFLNNEDVGVFADSVVGVATGLFHTCALSAAGQVRCWGENGDGQLGYGHMNDVGDNEDPAEVAPVSLGGVRALQVVAGAFHTCALLENRTVRCWGDNTHGQLGLNHTRSIGDTEAPDTEPVIDLVGPADGNVVALSAGFNHTCARLSTGNVRCWGAGTSGQLGYGAPAENVGDNEHPRTRGNIPVGFVGDQVAEIVTGAFHTCARIAGSNSVHCWGSSSSGQLGYTGTTSLSAPGAAINLGDTAVQLVAGYNHTCVRLSLGGVLCWGRATSGQLGYGNLNNIGDNEPPSAAGAIPFLRQ